MNKDPVRKLISDRIKARGLTPKSVSERLGKNHAYFQQYLERGIPRELGETTRTALSELLDIDESLIGGPSKDRGFTKERMEGAIAIPQFDVQAGAGPAVPIEQEREVGRWHLPEPYVRHSLSLQPNNLALIQVRGDSMEPTLRAGDLVMVDLSDQTIAQPGIFALYEGHGTVVKRVEAIPGSEPPKVRLLSDNPRHSAYDVLAQYVSIAGRVVWLGRRI